MPPSEHEKRLLAALDTEALTRLAVALVRINSVWDPQAGTSEQPAAEYVAEWAEQAGLTVTLEQVAPGRPNVIVRETFNTGRQTLMFEAHTDVVTPGDPAAWQYPPFEARVVGRRLYGRGSNDTKGNLAAMLIAIQALKRSGVPLRGTVVGGALCDEEDGMTGVNHFIDQGHADAVTAALICEPQDGLVCIAQKGAIRCRYTVIGRMSHGAMPLSGLNCAEAVARLIDGLHELENEALKNFGRDPLLGWPSFTPTVIRAPVGGAPQLNVVPGKAELLVDVRTVTGQNHAAIRRALTDLARQVEPQTREHYRFHDLLLNNIRNREIQIQTDFLADRPCTATAKSEPIAQAAAWATSRISGREAVYGGVPGATDGTFLWARKNIPIVTMGAGDRQVPHQVDEWVDLDQLIATAKIYALTAWRYLTCAEDKAQNGQADGASL